MLDLEIGRLQSSFAHPHEKRSISSATLFSHISLPSELLANMFMQALCDQTPILPPSSTNPPWVFLWVCSQWRQAALAEHRLWTHLDIQPSQIYSTIDIIRAWMPHLWDPTQKFPVSLTITSFDNDLVLHDMLSPYFSQTEASH